MYSLGEVSKMVSLSVPTLRRLVKRGGLGQVVGGMTILTDSDVKLIRDYLAQWGGKKAA